VSAHTPGPWRTYLQGDSTRYVVRPDTAEVNSREVAYVPANWNAVYDAPLIAAAPDLLEALKETASALQAACFIITDDVARKMALEMVADARAAIAKAEGA